MRILHVVEAVEAGCARYVTDLVTLMPDVESIVAMPRTRVGGVTDVEAAPRMVDAGADVRFVPMIRSVTAPANVAAIRHVRAIIDETRPDVVHTHASIGGVVGRTAALTSRRGRQAALVHTPNGVMPSRAVVTAERLLARATDAIIAVSDGEADELARLRIGRSEDRHTVHNGIRLDEKPPIDGEPFDLRGLMGIASDTKVVGCVARLAEQKGIDTFIATADLIHRRTPDVGVVLIGGGTLAPMVSAAAAHRPWLTWIDGMDEARRAICQMDVFMLLSRYEGLPFTILEALAAGVPVVATDVVGNREALDHGRVGTLVPPEDPDSAADAAGQLLINDNDRMIKAGRRRAESMYDVRVMAQMTRKVYNTVTR